MDTVPETHKRKYKTKLEFNNGKQFNNGDVN